MADRSPIEQHRLRMISTTRPGSPEAIATAISEGVGGGNGAVSMSRARFDDLLRQAASLGIFQAQEAARAAIQNRASATPARERRRRLLLALALVGVFVAVLVGNGEAVANHCGYRAPRPSQWTFGCTLGAPVAVILYATGVTAFVAALGLVAAFAVRWVRRG